MVDGLLEKRFKEANVLSLWLRLGPASANETRLTDKACMLPRRQLKNCCQSRPVTSVAFKVAINNTRAKPKA